MQVIVGVPSSAIYWSTAMGCLWGQKPLTLHLLGTTAGYQKTTRHLKATRQAATSRRAFLGHLWLAKHYPIAPRISLTIVNTSN